MSLIDKKVDDLHNAKEINEILKILESKSHSEVIHILEKAMEGAERCMKVQKIDQNKLRGVTWR